MQFGIPKLLEHRRLDAVDDGEQLGGEGDRRRGAERRARRRVEPRQRYVRKPQRCEQRRPVVVQRLRAEHVLGRAAAGRARLAARARDARRLRHELRRVGVGGDRSHEGIKRAQRAARAVEVDAHLAQRLGEVEPARPAVTVHAAPVAVRVAHRYDRGGVDARRCASLAAERGRGGRDGVAHVGPPALALPCLRRALNRRPARLLDVQVEHVCRARWQRRAARAGRAARVTLAAVVPRAERRVGEERVGWRSGARRYWRSGRRRARARHNARKRIVNFQVEARFISISKPTDACRHR